MDLFFVLSGFLITRILLFSKAQPNYFKKFYAKRTLRIFPLYYGVLWIILIIIPLCGMILRGYTYQYGLTQIFLWTYTINIAQLWIPNQISLLGFGHAWSLCIEEQFYLGWPLLIKMLNIRRIRIACMIIIGCAIISRIVLRWFNFSSTQIFFFTICHLDGLAIGSMLATFYVDDFGNACSPASWFHKNCLYGLFCSLLILAVILVIDKGRLRGGLLSQVIGFSIIATSWGALLAATLTSPNGSLLNNFFGLRFLGNLGKYSYGLYVFHPFVQEYTSNTVHYWVKLILGKSEFFLVLMCAGVFFVLSYLISFLSFNLYEKKWLRLKAYFN